MSERILTQDECKQFEDYYNNKNQLPNFKISQTTIRIAYNKIRKIYGFHDINRYWKTTINHFLNIQEMKKIISLTCMFDDIIKMKILPKSTNFHLIVLFTY